MLHFSEDYIMKLDLNLLNYTMALTRFDFALTGISQTPARASSEQILK